MPTIRKPFDWDKFDESHWPPLVGWLDEANCDVFRWRIARRVFRDFGIGERPKGSNRSGRIDTYLRRAKVPEAVIKSGKGYWCAAWAGAVWEDCGAKMWAGYADCDTWVRVAKQRGLWVPVTEIKDYEWGELVGGAPLYGVPGDASHIGVCVRHDEDYFMNGEGNTSSNGYSSNGTLCVLKDVSLTRLLGVAIPLAA